MEKNFWYGAVLGVWAGLIVSTLSHLIGRAMGLQFESTIVPFIVLSLIIVGLILYLQHPEWRIGRTQETDTRAKP